MGAVDRRIRFSIRQKIRVRTALQRLAGEIKIKGWKEEKYLPQLHQ